jgi:hypothetical protein
MDHEVPPRDGFAQIEDGETAMINENLNGLALQAWKAAMGDALTAVKLLRDSTDLSLREAAALIQKTAHQVGGSYNLRFVSGAQQYIMSRASDLFFDDLSQKRRAEHRAARNIKKVRGAK